MHFCSKPERNIERTKRLVNKWKIIPITLQMRHKEKNTFFLFQMSMQMLLGDTKLLSLPFILCKEHSGNVDLKLTQRQKLR